MNDLTIRVCFRKADGEIQDVQNDFGLDAFAGTLPSIGDVILAPGVLQGHDRRDPANREIWTVVGRMFNPLDHKDVIALIVEARTPALAEYSLLPSH